MDPQDDTQTDQLKSLVKRIIEFVDVQCHGDHADAVASLAMATGCVVKVTSNPAYARDTVVQIVDDILSGRAFGGGDHGGH